MGKPHRFETAQDRLPDPDPQHEAVAETLDIEPVAEVSEPEELKVRLAIKNRHIQELYEELAGARLSADEVKAVRDVGQRSISALEEERDGLQRRVQELEGDLRREREMRQELEDAYEERVSESEQLRADVGELRSKLDEEYELRNRLAEPENRLRAGVELFNDSEHRSAISSLSRSMGQPEVHVALDEGEEPPAILNFIWQGITWQTYAANPGLAVEEPRIYLASSGEDLSGVEGERPNAHVGAGGRIILGV
ncbi:hypothetical protein BH23ACT11_BH23ACT11_10880 [soil metagenome]